MDLYDADVVTKSYSVRPSTMLLVKILFIVAHRNVLNTFKNSSEIASYPRKTQSRVINSVV